MSFIQAVIFGTISGLTIFLGMPIARLQNLAKEYVSFLNAVAIGVLFFLFVDIIEHAVEPIEKTFSAGQSFFPFVLTLIAGFGVGLLGLVYYGHRYLRRGESITPMELALLVAVGIGLHNFAEGLAIGNAAQSGELKFALLLVVGFGLHNITEAFGISAPLAGTRAPWKSLLLLGAIAGGPNILGTIVGYGFGSGYVSILFLALAGGAIMYVIGELSAAGRKLSAHTWNGWGLLIGFFAGLLTDIILVALGA